MATDVANLSQLCASLRNSVQTYKKPKQCFSLDDIFDQAEKDIKASIAVNQDLRDEIDDIRDVIQTMTETTKKSTKALEKEMIKDPRLVKPHQLVKPRQLVKTKAEVLIAMRVDPEVKLTRGNTLDKASMWDNDSKN